jgi:hypothetical protein
MLQGNKGARDLIAAARDNILELTAGDPAMEIDIDTREDPNLLHGIRSTRELSGSAGEIFFRHTACVSPTLLCISDATLY